MLLACWHVSTTLGIRASRLKINTCSYDDHVVLGRQIVLHGCRSPRSALPDRADFTEDEHSEFAMISRVRYVFFSFSFFFFFRYDYPFLPLSLSLYLFLSLSLSLSLSFSAIPHDRAQSATNRALINSCLRRDSRRRSDPTPYTGFHSQLSHAYGPSTLFVPCLTEQCN